MMMTGEMVKEVFEGGFLESRFGLWSIKVQVLWLLGAWCYSLLHLLQSGASDFWQAFWAAILAWKWASLLASFFFFFFFFLFYLFFFFGCFFGGFFFVFFFFFFLLFFFFFFFFCEFLAFSLLL